MEENNKLSFDDFMKNYFESKINLNELVNKNNFFNLAKNSCSEINSDLINTIFIQVNYNKIVLLERRRIISSN